MAEWSKAHDWKSCVRLKRTEGSNPSLSAIYSKPSLAEGFVVNDEVEQDLNPRKEGSTTSAKQNMPITAYFVCKLFGTSC